MASECGMGIGHVGIDEFAIRTNSSAMDNENQYMTIDWLQFLADKYESNRIIQSRIDNNLDP